MHKEPIIGSHYLPYRETGMSGFGRYLWWAFCCHRSIFFIVPKNYLKYYFLEEYLFGDVRQNFNKRGYLLPEEFFSIVIWKANRAKTRIKNRLSKKGDIKQAVKELTSTFYRTKKLEDKLNVLIDAGFMLPMATAILTVLYPNDFSVYDVRVRNQLNIPEIYSTKKYFSVFLLKVKEFAKKQNLSLRNADRYLWGKSFYKDLKKFVK